MYAVIAHFDEKTDHYIRKIWKELKDKSISNYAYEVANRTPHLTLASYYSIDKSKFFHDMDVYYYNKIAVNITFSTIGSFIKSNTLFIAPTISKELLQFHSDHHLHFLTYQDNTESLYSPNRWIPHCTIANRLSSEKLAEAYKYCINEFKHIHGKINEIALIEVNDRSEVTIIHKKRLNTLYS